MPRTKAKNEEIKGATIGKIRDAGLKLFSTKGLAATSIADISEQAGISTGLMYHYYKSKEDLYAELALQTITNGNYAFIQISEMEISPKEKIILLVKNILEGLTKNDNSGYFFVFMIQVLLNKNLPKKFKPQAFIAHEQLISIIVEGQKEGQIKEGNPEAMSTLFLSTINGLYTYKLIMGRKFAKPENEWISQIFLK